MPGRVLVAWSGRPGSRDGARDKHDADGQARRQALAEQPGPELDGTRHGPVPTALEDHKTSVP